MSASKSERYKDAAAQIRAVNAGETSDIARYATTACILSHEFDHYYWTGFYMVDPNKDDELVVGPYQGTLGCLRIPFGKGVCGTAARDKKTQLVKDVHAFPGHIACDILSKSEIVVPVMKKGSLVAVLDVDSDQIAAFDETDQAGLEQICKELFD